MSGQKTGVAPLADRDCRVTMGYFTNRKTAERAGLPPSGEEGPGARLGAGARRVSLGPGGASWKPRASHEPQGCLGVGRDFLWSVKDR